LILKCTVQHLGDSGNNQQPKAYQDGMTRSEPHEHGKAVKEGGQLVTSSWNSRNRDIDYYLLLLQSQQHNISHHTVVPIQFSLCITYFPSSTNQKALILEIQKYS
jgi:hypothetical protein